MTQFKMTASYAASSTPDPGKYVYIRTDNGPDPRVMLVIEEVRTPSDSNTCHTQCSLDAIRIQGRGSSLWLMKRKRRAYFLCECQQHPILLALRLVGTVDHKCVSMATVRINMSMYIEQPRSVSHEGMGLRKCEMCMGVSVCVCVLQK